MASIARYGYTDTTITHVAEGAKLSRGIINFYFTTKDSMMRETLKFLLVEQLTSWQETLQEAPEGKKLQALVEAAFQPRHFSPRRLSVWSAFIGQAATSKEYRKLLAEAQKQWVMMVQPLCREAGLSDKEAPEAASQLVAFIHGCWLQGSVGAVGFGREDALALAQNFLQRLLSEKIATPRKPQTIGQQGAARPPAPRKKRNTVPEGQLDFGDLFAIKK